MDLDRTRALFDHQLRRGSGPPRPGVTVDRDDTVVRQSGPGWTTVVWSDLDTTTADGAIAAQIAYSTGRGEEVEWKLYDHDRPADLGERLQAAGFVPGPEETLMVAEARALTPGPAPVPGVRVERVTDAIGVDLMLRAKERAFGTVPSGLRATLLAGLDDGDLVLLVALAGDEAISSARIEFTPGTDFAGLWGGGTVPEWRGRGVYRALVAHRAALAVARGVRFLQVDASAPSRPILGALGFVRLGTTTPYVHTPVPAPRPL
ncbi:GNAT family N-acetyltransferase [Streptomyces sp. NPDC057638]|uniref:GNAT family N-acetyltransferase n=1 Tax=Streptomyces sp. NPDC057638 TaxID=3346190 RepID=UPI0036CEBBF6